MPYYEKPRIKQPVGRPVFMELRDTPVDRAIAAFGCASKLAKALGLTPKAIYRWRGTIRGHLKDTIPVESIPEVMEAAEMLGIELDIEDLYPKEPDMFT